MSRIVLRGVTLQAGERVLCRRLSLEFRAGENWAILGANGSGKTTLLHTVAGLRVPEQGTVVLDGKDVRHWRARERALQIGLLFQDYTLAFPSTVLDTVLTGRHPHLGRWASEGDEDIRRAKQALADVGMATFANRLVATLSGGERRRVEIAALLAQDAPICLWDEPANHLDLRHRTQVLRLLAARAERPGHLNLFVLHDVNAAWRLCSHALLLLPDGDTRAGRTAEVLSKQLLEEVYGCAFRESVDGEQRYYIPQ